MPSSVTPTQSATDNHLGALAPQKTIALLSIGTELTRGEIENKNAVWLSQTLIDLGHEVTEIVTIDDDDGRIIDTLKRLGSAHAAIITTGGLGPTTDDRTTTCVAQVLGVPLVRDPHSMARIFQLFRSRGREPSPSNQKQADFPAGATVLDNELGTAPGFFVDITGARAFFLPGVPAEMRGLFEAHVRHHLPSPGGPVAVRRVRVLGMPESVVGERLAGLEEEHGVTIGYRASAAEIEVKVLARAPLGDGATREAQLAAKARAEQKAEAVIALVKERLEDGVYTDQDDSLSAHISRLFLEAGLTLGFAESCTGGLLSQLITERAGASGFFRGAIVSYDNAVKTSILGVSELSLRDAGAVSEEVARQMAEGARRALGVDVSLAVTGIAGPGGGSADKPVGLVHWAVSHAGGTECFQSTFRGARSQIQKRAAVAGLDSVRRVLQRLGTGA